MRRASRLFAAGDLRAQLTRQVTTAVGDANAAIAAGKYSRRSVTATGSRGPGDGATPYEGRVVTVVPSRRTATSSATNRRAGADRSGDEAARIIRMVRESGATIEAIWLTHAHLDHIGAIAASARMGGDVPVFCTTTCRYIVAPRNSEFYGLELEQPPTRRELADSRADARIDALHSAPHAGHSPVTSCSSPTA